MTITVFWSFSVFVSPRRTRGTHFVVDTVKVRRGWNMRFIWTSRPEQLIIISIQFKLFAFGISVRTYSRLLAVAVYKVSRCERLNVRHVLALFVVYPRNAWNELFCISALEITRCHFILQYDHVRNSFSNAIIYNLSSLQNTYIRSVRLLFSSIIHYINFNDSFNAMLSILNSVNFVHTIMYYNN